MTVNTVTFKYYSNVNNWGICMTIARGARSVTDSETTPPSAVSRRVAGGHAQSRTACAMRARSARSPSPASVRIARTASFSVTVSTS